MADQKTYTFINPDDLKVVPATKWVIKPLIPAAEILVGCGAPKHLKTLLLQGALFTVASHLPDFFGYEIPHRRKLLYAINEGGDAFLGRIKDGRKLTTCRPLRATCAFASRCPIWPTPSPRRRSMISSAE